MARSKKTKRYKWSRSDKIFASLYVIGFVGAALIGMFGSSWFAYDTFNALWADLLYIFFLSLIYVTAFAQEVFDCRKTRNIVINFLIFIVGLVIFLLALLLWRALLILSILHSAAVLVYLGIRYALTVRAENKAEVDTKQCICAFSFLLFAMLSLSSVEFVNSTYMAWALVPTAVLFCILFAAAFFLLRGEWSRVLGSTQARRIGSVILCSIGLFAIVFMYSFTAIGLINCSFHQEYTQREYTVLDKKVRSGARQVTEFEIKIELDGKEKWIEVPVTDYHALSEGDGVVVNYYSGTLGFPYWKYAGMTSEQ